MCDRATVVVKNSSGKFIQWKGGKMMKAVNDPKILSRVQRHDIWKEVFWNDFFVFVWMVPCILYQVIMTCRVT